MNPAEPKGTTEHRPEQEHVDDEGIGAMPAPPRSRMLALIGLGVLLALGGLFAAGFVPYLRRERALAEEAARVRSLVPRVVVVHPKPAPASETVELTAGVRALQETDIYARTSGYVKRWLADIGDDVALGTVLAEIDTPELDQELLQAQAQVRLLEAKARTAEASAGLAGSSYARFLEASRDGAGAISSQDLEERAAATLTAQAMVEAARADVAVGEASVRRLTELKSFARITAPFAGTITQRWVEVGALVSAGTGQGRPLFRLQQIDVVRVFVDVPQSLAPGVRTGEPAEVTVREFPGRKFPGRITRTTRALDPTSRTLTVEVHVPNKGGPLAPGMFARARLTIPRERRALLVPSNALVVSASGVQVGVVDEASRAHMRPVVVETDYGAQVAISEGLEAGDRVISNPGERLAEGAEVQVQSPDDVRAEASPEGGTRTAQSRGKG